MSEKKLFHVQDRGTITGSGLLYYIKSILTAVLNNVYIPISLVTGAQYQAVDIVLDENSIFNFGKVHNLANSYSKLLSNEIKHCFV